MSEGPIKRWRDSYKPPQVTTDPKKAVHLSGMSTGLGRGLCGHKGGSWTNEPEWVTCMNCKAAITADVGESR